MLIEKDNEMITRTGAGTPMGQLFRRYWLPALLSEEIPETDCAPVQVRVLGEELVAFRDSQGRVGLLDEHCAHRGTSLFYGRNEECGLRCIYHGWKYDVDGNVLDTPAEPAGSDFKTKIRHKDPMKNSPCFHRTSGSVYLKIEFLLPRFFWNVTTCRASRVTVTHPIYPICTDPLRRKPFISKMMPTRKMARLNWKPRRRTSECEWFRSGDRARTAIFFVSLILLCRARDSYQAGGMG